jgi:hypothetical protein
MVEKDWFKYYKCGHHNVLQKSLLSEEETVMYMSGIKMQMQESLIISVSLGSCSSLRHQLPHIDAGRFRKRLRNAL